MTDHAVRGRTRYPGTIDARLQPSWSPKYITSLACWIDFTDTNSIFIDNGVTRAINNGDLIYRANDKSGLGRHFYQTTENKRPAYRPSVGIGAAEFDGSNDNMQSSELFFTSSGTIVAAIYLSSTSQRGVVAGAGILDHGWHFGLGASTLEDYGNDFVVLYSQQKWVDTNDLIGLGNRLLTYKMSNYAGTMYINGVNVHSTSATTATPTVCMTIGGEGDATNRFFTDHIYEVVYFNEALSDANRILVENYLMAKHGIS